MYLWGLSELSVFVIGVMPTILFICYPVSNSTFAHLCHGQSFSQPTTLGFHIHTFENSVVRAFLGISLLNNIYPQTIIWAELSGISESVMNHLLWYEENVFAFFQFWDVLFLARAFLSRPPARNADVLINKLAISLLHSIHWLAPMLTTLRRPGSQFVCRKFLEFLRLISIPLTYRTTNYGLVTNFWGKFTLAAPPPLLAGGKLANSLVDSHSRSGVQRQDRGRHRP